MKFENCTYDFRKYEKCKPNLKILKSDEEAMQAQIETKENILTECDDKHKHLEIACNSKKKE